MGQHGLPHFSDEALLGRYQQGDGAAFKEFFDRHHALIFNYLLSKLRGDRAEAEEAFQKTFMKVHRYVISYDPEQKAMAWLMTIAKNVAIDSMRASVHPRDIVEVDDSLVSGADEPAAHEARSTVVHIFESLSPEERDILERRFLNDDTYGEIASETGLSEMSARKRISRLVKKIKSELIPI